MKTRAALFHAVGEPFEIAEIELADPGPRDVVVAMRAVGICGTDLHQVKGEFRRPTPMVLGHEGAGVVEAVGAEVTSVALGDPVVLSWAPGCGSCVGCRRGRPATCRVLNAAIPNGTLPDGTTGMSYRGQTVYRGTATGCLAERCVVSERAVLPLHDTVPFEQAALLGCAALTGVGAVLNAAQVARGESVLVLGAGGVGQFVVQGAVIAGAAPIVVVDPVAGRREAAVGLGATHAFAPEELPERLAEILPDGVDVALDVVGDPATTATALEHTRDGGLTVIVGIPAAGRRLDLDPAQLIRREKRLTGTLYGSADPAVALPQLLAHLASGRLDLVSLVGPRFALDDVNAAIETSLAGSPGRVHVIPGRG
jgi:S-(hydroxymethyl)glutathione dehydrogenase/alcohol dehydrogenase